MKKIDQEEFVKLYKTLPPKLQSALFSEEIGNNVEKICRRYEINDKFSDILNAISQTLLGLLPIEDFEKVLIRDVGINMSQSKEIFREITRFVFFPIRDDLAEVYGTGSESEKILEKTEEISSVSEDAYREPL